jgi:two-component system sensor histidine kinase DctS
MKTQIIEEKNKMFQKIMDNFPSMIGYWDKNLKNKFSNSAYKDYFQRDEENIYDKHISEVIGVETYKKNIKYIEAVLRGEEQYFERELTKNGNTRFTQAMYIPDIEDGIVIGFYVLVNDVTQIKKIEKERNEMYQKLIQSSKMVALGEMAGGMAHEINNPLSIIKMNATFASDNLKKDNFDRTKIEKNINLILSTSDRIEKIVAGLLYFSQESPSSNFVSTSIASIIQETTIFCLQKMNSKKINFIQPFIDANIFVDCCSIQISQVILNLLNNAIDAVEGCFTKWISLDVKTTSDLVIITISDSGPGISSEIKERLMQPFATTKAAGKGIGLGLSISKGIIDRHNGTLIFDESTEHTTVRITLKKSA